MIFKTSLLAFLSLASLTAHGELMDRCGDCWCIHDGSGCPTDTTGIVDSFSNDDVIMRTFQLTNEIPKLETADGQDCFPYVDSVGPIDRYPKSNDPQCAKPAYTDETVCAYLYEEDTEICLGRNYQAITYDSEAAAEAAGTVITHKSGEFDVLLLKVLEALTKPHLISALVHSFSFLQRLSTSLWRLQLRPRFLGLDENLHDS
jgi:hypothetical protein